MSQLAPALATHIEDPEGRSEAVSGDHACDHELVIDVSVCIANWNCRELLRDCLNSLSGDVQRIRLEIIVVDNASRDGSATMVASEFPDVHLIINATNRGFARANNQAARRARGKYLLFLNNDTRVPPETLRKLLDYMEANPQVGMVGPRLRDAHGNIQVSYRPRPTLLALLHRTSLFRWTGVLRSAYLAYRRTSFLPDGLRAVDVLMGAAVLLRNKEFKAWGGWDEAFTFGGEDMELSYRVNRHAAVMYYPGAEIVHVGRASTRQHVGFTSVHIAIGMVQYLRKTGASELGLCIYKLAQTLDAPMQLLIKLVEYVCRLLKGERRRADQSLNIVRGLSHFLTHGLVALWRA